MWAHWALSTALIAVGAGAILLATRGKPLSVAAFAACAGFASTALGVANLSTDPLALSRARLSLLHATNGLGVIILSVSAAVLESAVSLTAAAVALGLTTTCATRSLLSRAAAPTRDVCGAESARRDVSAR